MRCGLIIILVFIFFLSLHCNVSAQADTSELELFHGQDIDIDIESIIEEKIEAIGEEVDFSEEAAEILKYAERKVNINSISPEIAAIKLHLSDYQYYNLQKYIDDYGELVSVGELYAIEGFDRRTVERIVPEVTVAGSKRKRLFSRFFQNGRHELLMRYGQVLERQVGYMSDNQSGYLGSQQKYVFKYFFESNDIFSLGFSAEKDPGEEFFRGTQRQGFDFYSFHIGLKNIGVLRKMVIGDYRLNFGQGVVLGIGLLGAKGGDAGSCRKFPTGIRMVTPLNEGEFFRGAAAEIGNTSYNGTIFYSHSFYDGALTFVDSADDEAVYEGSFNNTGYHRTENEVKKKNALMKRLYGFHFQLNRRIFRFGVTGLRTEFDKAVAGGGAVYQQYRFSGSGNSNLSVDYQLILQKCLLYGEVGIDKNFRVGLLQGATFNIDPRVKMSAIFRYYDKSYIALNSGAFGNNSPNQNELGLYVVADIVLGRRVEMSLGADFYTYPWLQYGVDAPSNGCDFICKLAVAPTRNTKINLRYDYRNKSYNVGGEYVNGIGCSHRQRFKSNFIYTPFKFLKLKTEADLIVNTHDNLLKSRTGILLFQDADFNIDKIGLTLKTRLAYFDTDSYDERIYAYENDILYSFTVNSHFDTGIRAYIMLKYNYKWFNVWLRVARTFYMNKESIGSGLDKINGQHRTELKVQMAFKW